MGAAGESTTAIATLLKQPPRGSAQAGSLTQDQVGQFAARAEGEGELAEDTMSAGARGEQNDRPGMFTCGLTVSDVSATVDIAKLAFHRQNTSKFNLSSESGAGQTPQ
jgi:hypothetical protein